MSWPHDSLESILYSGIRLAFCTLYSGMAALMSSGLYTACPRARAMSRKKKPDECLQRPGSETRILILMPKPKNNPSPECRISQSSHQLRNGLLFSHSPGLFECLLPLSPVALRGGKIRCQISQFLNWRHYLARAHPHSLKDNTYSWKTVTLGVNKQVLMSCL